MPGGRKSARRGRVDYKKLSSGETDWREEDVNIVQNTPAKGRNNKSRESIETSTVETYLLMLYVTLEQEKALKEIFQNRKWPFLKPDLSSLTDKTGPTALNHRQGSRVNKPDVNQSNNNNNNNNGSAQDDPDNITDNVAESQEQPTEVNDDVIGDSDMEGIDNEELDNNVDNVEVSPPKSTSKKRKLSNSPAVSSPKRKAGSAKKKAGKTKGEVSESGKKSEEPKVDGTDNDTNADAENVEEDVSNLDEYTEIINKGTDGSKVVTLTLADKELNSEGGLQTVNIADDSQNELAGGTDEVYESPDVGNDDFDAVVDTKEGIITKEVRCWDCDAVLKDKDDHDQHMMKEHNFDVKTGRYYCQECDKYYKQPDYLAQHIKHVHKGAKRKPQKTTRDHICDICGRSFKRPDQLKEHRSMVHFKTPLNSHECEICGKTFSRPRLLGYHMNKHIGSKPFECSTCGNSYFSRGGLYVHSRMCQRLNPSAFNCEICHKNFSNQYALKVHMKGIHGTSQPAYKCGCGKLIKWKTSIRKHQHTCPQNARNVTQITRTEYEEAVSALTKAKVREDFTGAEIIVEAELGNAESQVTEVTDEKLVEEITGKIADELSKTGSVNTDDEKMITETIRNAVLSGEETQVITIPRPAGADNEENVYYVIVNPAPDQQIMA